MFYVCDPEDDFLRVNAERLDLSNLNFDDLSKHLADLIVVKKLRLSWSKITRLLLSIGQMRRLQELDISYSDLLELPEEMINLTELKRLDLTASKIARLPPFIGTLKTLEELRVSSANLLELPAESGNLTALKWLNISHSKINRLPPAIGQLKNLRELSLNNTPLSELPSEIGNLGCLKRLNLAHSKVTCLPPSFWKLKSLKELFLFSMTIDLQKEIAELENLVFLNLWWSKITSVKFPPIERLNNLSELIIEDTSFPNLQDGSIFQNLARRVPICRSLQYIRMNKLLSDEERTQIGIHLAQNRARRRIICSIRPKQWPLVLNKASRAFDQGFF